MRKLLNPIKSLQKYFNIESEVQQFKLLLKPHNPKIYFMSLTTSIYISYQYYKPYQGELSQLIHNKFARGSNINTSSKYIGIELVKDILLSNEVKSQSQQFVNELVKEKDVQLSIADLLTQSIKEDKLKQQAGLLGKEITNGVLRDKNIEADVVQLLITALKNDQFQKELVDTLVWLTQQQEVQQGMTILMKKVVQDEQVGKAFEKTCGGGIINVLQDEEVQNKFKLFLFYILMKKEQEQNEQKSVKSSIIDFVVGKIVSNKEQEEEIKFKDLVENK